MSVGDIALDVACDGLEEFCSNFIVIIGGVGTIEGPIIGVIVFYAMQHYLADSGAWYLMLLGTLAIVTITPKGIWGHIAQRYCIALFPVRRMLVRSHE